MIKWFLEVIVGWPFCRHQWEVLSKSPVYMGTEKVNNKQLPVYLDYHLQCKKCGNIKVKRT